MSIKTYVLTADEAVELAEIGRVLSDPAAVPKLDAHWRANCDDIGFACAQVELAAALSYLTPTCGISHYRNAELFKISLSVVRYAAFIVRNIDGDQTSGKMYN